MTYLIVQIMCNIKKMYNLQLLFLTNEEIFVIECLEQSIHKKLFHTIVIVIKWQKVFNQIKCNLNKFFKNVKIQPRNS